MKLKTPWLVLAILLLFLAPILAKNPDGKSQQDRAQPTKPSLIQKYLGIFRWDGDMATQKVVIEFLRVGEKDGVLTAHGVGRYDDQVEIKVEARVYPQTGKIEIWESSPVENGEASDTFDTEGSHRGTISPDFREIEAVWSSENVSDGAGTLTLRALK